ncbi:type II toxin-antitoxin system HicB family antitoxin [Vibrio sp.]|nr:type II toxin-antitoxin system HicB family antitoxin [Vibrio sp.]
MLYAIAIEVGGEGTAYSVCFPDLTGCFSSGDSMDEALSNAKVAVEFYLEDLSENSKIPPSPRSLSDWKKYEEYEGWSWGIVDIDIDSYLIRSIKINVT